jgi:hypothetical protein
MAIRIIATTINARSMEINQRIRFFNVGLNPTNQPVVPRYPIVTEAANAIAALSLSTATNGEVINNPGRL